MYIAEITEKDSKLAGWQDSAQGYLSRTTTSLVVSHYIFQV